MHSRTVDVYFFWGTSELGLDRCRVDRVGEPLPDLAHGVEKAIHRGDRCEMDALVEQGRVHLSGRGIDEPVTVQGAQDCGPLILAQRPWLRLGLRLGHAGGGGLLAR